MLLNNEKIRNACPFLFLQKMAGGERGKHLVNLALLASSASDDSEKQYVNNASNNIAEIVDAGLIFEDGTYNVDPKTNTPNIIIIQNDAITYNESESDLNNVLAESLFENVPVTNYDQTILPSSELEVASDSDFVPESENESEDSLQEDSDQDEEQENVQNVEEQGVEEVMRLRNETDKHTTPGVGKRRRKADPDSWKRNASKIKRMKGETYLGYTRTRNGEVRQNQQRPARSQWLGCISKECLKSNKRHCNLFTKEQMDALFTKFWKLSWEEKKVYVCSLVDFSKKQRSYTNNPSRRWGSFIYHLKKDDGKFIVCKKMFLGCLGLKEKMVHSWVRKSQLGILEITPRTENNNMLRKRTIRTDYLKTFFDSLPKQPSHYCRKDTSKVYLEQSFRSKAQLYECYKEKCQQDNVQPYTISTFNSMFDDMKLSIFNPRKDECDTCHSYKINQISEEEYRSHILSKDRARDEKIKDKENALKKLNYTFTMDTQAVKLCPVLNVSAAYYKTKLQVHNFTIFNLATHQCSNYLWDETEGDLSASVFVTSIIKHLEEQCLTEKQKLFCILTVADTKIGTTYFQMLCYIFQ